MHWAAAKVTSGLNLDNKKSFLNSWHSFSDIESVLVTNVHTDPIHITDTNMNAFTCHTPYQLGA